MNLQAIGRFKFRRTLRLGPINRASGALASVSDGPVLCYAVPREIPSFRIFEISVVLFNPSLAAAPLRPPTTQLVSRRVAMICALSESASVPAAVSGNFLVVSSATGACSSIPLVRTTDRSMKFWSSLMLPGQHNFQLRSSRHRECVRLTYPGAQRMSERSELQTMGCLLRVRVAAG